MASARSRGGATALDMPGGGGGGGGGGGSGKGSSGGGGGSSCAALLCGGRRGARCMGMGLLFTLFVWVVLVDEEINEHIEHRHVPLAGLHVPVRVGLLRHHTMLAPRA